MKARQYQYSLLLRLFLECLDPHLYGRSPCRERRWRPRPPGPCNTQCSLLSLHLAWNIEVHFLSPPGALLSEDRNQGLVIICASCWKHTALNHGSLPQVTLISLVPSKEPACVRLPRKRENPTSATLLCWGYFGLAVSQGDVCLIGESSLKSSPKGSWPHGQMLCPVGKEPKEQCPALPRTALLSRRTVGGGGHSPGYHHTGASQLSPLSLIRAS